MDIDDKLLDFYHDLTESVKMQAEKNGVGCNTQLVDYLIDQLQETKLMTNPILSYWQGRTPTNGSVLIYGYDYDDIAHELSLYASDFKDGATPYIITRDLVNDLAIKALRFPESCACTASTKFKATLEDDAFDLYELIIQELTSDVGISKITIDFFSNGVFSERFKKLPCTSSIAGIPTEIQVWGIQRLYDMLSSGAEYEDTEFDLSQNPNIPQGGFPCLHVSQVDDDLDCYLAVVPGAYLAEIYHEYGSKLLEGNVRSFLSVKTSVNKEIQNTINNKPGCFFIYNNGIAATATSIEVNNNGSIPLITKIKNMQIINGGQTTASLAYSAQKKTADFTNLYVQMKITIIHKDNPDDVSEMVQKISETSNSQNKVSAEDFFSNHDFHKIMKSISTRISVGPRQPATYSTYCYYERVKGQYKQETMFFSKSKKEDFYRLRPVDQMFTKSQFATYDCLIHQMPKIVSKGKNESTKEFRKQIDKAWETESGKAKYNDGYFKEVVSAGMIYRAMESRINKKQCPWFQGSYRANIIAYTMAVFFKLVKEQFPKDSFDLSVLWDRYQLEVPDSLMDQLIDIAQKVYATLTAPYRPEENVTQWCKKDSCWESVKNAFSDYALNDNRFKQFLILAEDHLGDKKSNQDTTRIVNEVTLMNQVLSPPMKGEWNHVLEFVNKNGRAMNVQAKALKSLQLIARLDKGIYGSVPKTDDFKNALNLWYDATALGFKP